MAPGRFHEGGPARLSVSSNGARPPPSPSLVQWLCAGGVSEVLDVPASLIYYCPNQDESQASSARVPHPHLGRPSSRGGAQARIGSPADAASPSRHVRSALSRSRHAARGHGATVAPRRCDFRCNSARLRRGVSRFLPPAAIQRPIRSSSFARGVGRADEAHPRCTGPRHPRRPSDQPGAAAAWACVGRAVSFPHASQAA